MSTSAIVYLDEAPGSDEGTQIQRRPTIELNREKATTGYSRARNVAAADFQANGEAQVTFKPNRPHGHHQPIYHIFGRGGAGPAIPWAHSIFHFKSAELARTEAASWAQMSPLMAATLGPLAVLLGIPSLTQRWRGQLLVSSGSDSGLSNYVSLPDPTLNLILAGICLFCEVAGNGMLILRFSNFHTKITTWVSYAFWIMKIVLGIANYIQFGIAHPQSEDIIYLEGFWVKTILMNKLI
jgi:hypothetical protein